MIKISAVVITFNEARNIGRCIESLIGVADEIVVLDSFSTDQTKEICEGFGVEFHTHAFDGYAEQKNRGNLIAKNSVILSLDADEALDNTLRESILRAKANWNTDAYALKRLTNYCGTWIRHSGWYPDTKIRLFDKSVARWEARKVHEFLSIKKGAKVEKLEGDLLHYSFYTVQQHMDTVNKFSTLKAEQLYESGKRANYLQMIVAPPFKFFKQFVLKAGFLDGYAGFVIAVNSAHGVFLKYAKLRMLSRNKSS
jgi:glycosyltransferase involved in cell wall biosynthesis